MKVSVRNSSDEGPLFVDNPNSMCGQDGAYSIPLGDGRVLWFFGDTLIGERRKGQSLWYEFGLGQGQVNMNGWGNFRLMLNNTALLVREDLKAAGFKTPEFIVDQEGEMKQLIRNLPSEPGETYRMWCLDGVTLDGVLYLYYVKIEMIPDKPVLHNFRIIGSGLARGDMNHFDFQRLGGGPFHLYWENNQPIFGSAVLDDPHSSWLYVYGYYEGSGGTQHCYLSRVKKDSLEDLAEYRYFDGEGWEPQVTLRHPVMEGMPNEMSVSWNPYLESYLAVHSLGVGGKIVGRTAVNPWGPWSSPFLLWKVDPLFPGTADFIPLIYAGKEHPELSEDRGRVIYITYIEFEEYYPHLVRVELQK